MGVCPAVCSPARLTPSPSLWIVFPGLIACKLGMDISKALRVNARVAKTGGAKAQ